VQRALQAPLAAPASLVPPGVSLHTLRVPWGKQVEQRDGREDASRPPDRVCVLTVTCTRTRQGAQHARKRPRTYACKHTCTMQASTNMHTHTLKHRGQVAALAGQCPGPSSRWTLPESLSYAQVAKIGWKIDGQRSDLGRTLGKG
jgi:hypothetical protein